VRADPARPGITNLLAIYAAATGASIEQAETHFADARGYGDVKKELVDILVETLRPLRERYAELSADPETMRDLLRQGADAVRPIARETVDRTKYAMGAG
jgi:tryptophanyl-tRNA synthetase